MVAGGILCYFQPPRYRTAASFTNSLLSSNSRVLINGWFAIKRTCVVNGRTRLMRVQHNQSSLLPTQMKYSYTKKK
ncbi:hypothetical protein B0F90DRAFT_1694477 [Multifurca ochricompacta]|uniref:Uncharacterized protein n=1 Tax=Multifurca ochricompacta TaxID=376703 RepID=A0AAD4M8S6_9AGAM|nr:hypothetical protein B0F90DRAFT_1694477 [Multifurca ochricompacta]